jgi:alcohol dehydrogenase class IV
MSQPATAVRFTFDLPTSIRFGAGEVRGVGAELAGLGVRRPLLVGDEGVERAGLLHSVRGHLAGHVESWTTFSDVPPNPPVACVDRGRQAYLDGGCDGLLAVGGGSVIDACKAIGLLATHPGPLQRYEAGAVPLERAIPPMVAVPTTAGTGSEVGWAAVITDAARVWKMSIGDPRLAPRVAILDPALTLTCPPAVTAASGMDALTHAVECYVCRGAGFLSDGLALHAAGTIGRWLRRAVERPGDLEARSRMLAASVEAGIAMYNGGLGVAHALSHPLTAHHGIPHGVANAALLPYVVQFNLDTAGPRYGEVATALAGAPAPAAELPRLLRRLAAGLGLPSLRSAGVPRAELGALAAEALGNPDDLVSINPRRATHADLVGVCEAAWSDALAESA